MNTIESWNEAITGSFQNLFVGFVDFLPKVFIALVVFIIGWMVAVIAEGIIRGLVRHLLVDKFLAKIGVKNIFERAGMKIDIGWLIGKVVKWFLILAFLLAVTDILNLDQITGFLNKVVLFLPNVLVAVIILVAAVVIGEFVEKLIRGGTQAAGFRSSHFIANLAKWAIIVFGVLASLAQLQIAKDLISILFMGFVAMFAVAGGLAFGLGGRDMAKDLIEKIRSDFKR